MSAITICVLVMAVIAGAMGIVAFFYDKRKSDDKKGENEKNDKKE